MKKVVILSLALFFVTAGIRPVSKGMANPIPDDRILIDSGVSSWIPNPLVGSHDWKKFFSDEKYSPSKKLRQLGILTRRRL